MSATADATPRTSAQKPAHVVVKLGGRPIESPEGRAALAAQIATLRTSGVRPIIVHGGGVQVTRALEAAGIEARFVEGLRVTDERTLETAEPVFTHVGKLIAHALTEAGAPAIALTGRDAALLEGVVKDPALGRVGTIIGVNKALLETLGDNGLTAVVGPLAVDAHGALNVNADEVAGALASAIGARELVLLTDVPAVRNSDGEPIRHLTRAAALALIDGGVATGGMVPKLRGALDALAHGVRSVRVLDTVGLGDYCRGQPAGTLFTET